jgi:cytochrome c5
MEFTLLGQDLLSPTSEYSTFRPTGCFLDEPITAILSRLGRVFSTSFQRVTVSQNDSSDTQFVNSFSVVLGLLIAFAIVLFAFARSIGTDIQAGNLMEDPLSMKNVRENTEPFARVAIAGHDNSALAALTKPAAAGPAAVVPGTPELAFQQVCSACHSTGVNGAPKIGDHAAWGPRIAQGKDTLYKDAIGGKGNMPPKGGTTWPDDTIRKVVDYMVSLNK